MEKEITKENKEYVFIKCPHCKIKLRFQKEPRGRRVYGKCLHCGKNFELVIK